MPSPEVVGGKRSVHVDTPAAGRDPTPGGAPCKRQRSVGRLDPAAGQQEAVAGQHGGVAGQQEEAVAGQQEEAEQQESVPTALAMSFPVSLSQCFRPLPSMICLLLSIYFSSPSIRKK
jgi:hypothetical protein